MEPQHEQPRFTTILPTGIVAYHRLMVTESGAPSGISRLTARDYATPRSPSIGNIARGV